MTTSKRTFFGRYWWIFAGVLSAVALSTALNISNTDGWIVVTNSSNDSWIVNWNTTRPSVCASGNYSYWNGSTFLCSPDQSGSANLSGYVPYTGATQNVNINGFILQSHGVRSTDSAGLLIESASGTDSALFGVGNTANILFYGSLDMNTGTNICLSGVCRTTWPADTYSNVTALQTANTTTNARIDSLNTTKLNITDQRYNDTAAINAVSTFAQTKAATGSVTSASLCLQNVTIGNSSVTGQYTSCGSGGGGVTLVNSGNGLTGGPITTTGTLSVNSPTCGAGEYLRWTGTAFTCSTPATGGGNAAYQVSTDFIGLGANNFAPFIGAATSSGTSTNPAPVYGYPGVVTLRDSTTANGGYRYTTGVTDSFFIGNETFRMIAYTPTTSGTRAGITGFYGFHDATSITQPVDGCYFRQVAGVFRGECRNNAGPTITATNYTVTTNTWYDYRITMAPNAANATFEIYSEAGAQLWNGTVAANIPNTSARVFGSGVGAWESTTDAAGDIIWIDYVKASLNNAVTITR